MKKLILSVIILSIVLVATSYPSSYAFDFIASQANDCAVRIENPAARTGLGLVGTITMGSGWYAGLISQVIEHAIPETSTIFHGARCH